MSHPRSRGHFIYLKTRTTGEENRVLSVRHRPPTVWKPQFHWLESLIGSSSTAAPHPSRRMIEAHQPMGGNSVHTGEIGPHPRFRNPPNLYSPSNAGTITIISWVDVTPRTACQPRLHWLISRDWLVGFDPISSQLF